MKRSLYIIQLLAFALPAWASGDAQPINLSAVLQLTNARSLEVELAQEKLNEAKALHASAVSQFFPWLAPGVVYKRHDNLIQAVDGQLLDVQKQSWAPGVAIAAEMQTGDAIYRKLAASQQVKAAQQALAAERQQSMLMAVSRYFALLRSQASVQVAQEAVRISEDYLVQLNQAVEAGLAFKGDELRVRTQTARNQLQLEQARTERRLAAARLAEVLHLDPAVDLIGASSELAPLKLHDSKGSPKELVAQALKARPEQLQNAALVGSAQAGLKGAVYGPLLPNLGAQAFFGGLGGDSDVGNSRFDAQQDYSVGLSWRIGPGGLFDPSRKQSAQARLRTAEIVSERMRERIAREVVEAEVRCQALAQQVKTAKTMVAAAEQGFALARERKEFAVGIVLETLKAEEDLTRARQDYFKTIAEFNAAQYELNVALGPADGKQSSPKAASGK